MEMGDKRASVTTELRLPLEELEWWGAALGVLVAVFHHPHVLAREQPETDPLAVAGEVLDRLDELASAMADAAAGTDPNDADVWRQPVALRREGDELVIWPAHEVADLAWCLEVFATGVLEPDGPQAALARGATSHAASAWSRHIGEAAGTLPRRRSSSRSAGPAAADASQGRETS